MDENKEAHGTPQECTSDCVCHQKNEIPLKIKVILLLAIFIVAGSVLVFSITKKLRVGNKPATTSFAAVLAQKPGECAAPQSTPQKTAAAAAPTEKASLTPLASLSSLDTVAHNVEGVFILLAGDDTQSVDIVIKEIETAKNTIASRGIQMGSFILKADAPDISLISQQLPPPCIVVAFKGRGMRGISCAGLTQDKLLQTCLATMQPSGCCPTNGNRSCSTK